MRRAFKTVFYMRGNFVNKEGKSPIVLRITLDGDRVTIGTTGITITPSLWDIKKQRLKGKSTEALQVNKKLDNTRMRSGKSVTSLSMRANYPWKR